MIGTIYVRDKITGKLVEITALVGPSAFDVAVQEGFAGTKTEWLRSLIGDVSEATVAFTIPVVRQNVVSGDTVPVVVGKLAKLQADLKAVAFSGTYSDLSGRPTKVSDFSNDSGFQTAYQVNAAIAALVNGSPEALDTLQELAAALGDDPNFSTTVMGLIGQKANTSAMNAALALKADKSKFKTATLAAANWTESSGVFVYTISDSDILNNVVIDLDAATDYGFEKMEEFGFNARLSLSVGSFQIKADTQPTEDIDVVYAIKY